MSKTTYYVVQTAPGLFMMNADECGHVNHEGHGIGCAERMSISRARHICRNERMRLEADGDAARRFPRIVKVSIETKTIQDRR